MGSPWALGGGQAWLINRGLHSALCSLSSLPCFVHIAGLRPRHQLCCKQMATLHMLWMGLVLLGLLGFPQTPAQDHDTVQPNFQQDKVREGPLPHTQGNRALGSEPDFLSQKRVCRALSAMCACAWELAGTALAHSLVGPPDYTRSVACSDTHFTQ